MEAIVNKDTCISCGACVGLCPEVYSFDEDDKAEAISGELPEELQDGAVEGRDSCPVAAIDINE
ncbi:MAG: ferredoxin [Clostridium sp.]